MAYPGEGMGPMGWGKGGGWGGWGPGGGGGNFPAACNVYVAGIPEACTEQEFRDFFAQYGTVAQIKIRHLIVM